MLLKVAAFLSIVLHAVIADDEDMPGYVYSVFLSGTYDSTFRQFGR